VSRRLVAVGVAVAFAAVLLSFLLYTRQMADVLRRDAAVFGRLYGLVIQAAGAQHSELERELTEAAQQTILGELGRLQIPVVITDTTGAPLSAARLPFAVRPGEPADSVRLRAYVSELDRRNAPLEVVNSNLRVHYGEPITVRRLRWIPWLAAAALLAVVGGGAWLIFTSFHAERERIWSAMARESAHQMGTPLSSLVGWLEHLESETGPRHAEQPNVVGEMEADVQRLQKVSRRFELIGRKPGLEPVSIGHIVENLRRYFSARLPTLGGRVSFDIDVPAIAPSVLGNETLLEWAFENLIKNSIDALAGSEGTIRVSFQGVNGNRALFQVSDTGPGVDPHVRSKLFEIGVTTKERGWGVGLSLTRRIIEDMHGGAIWLDHADGGASFRLQLPVAREGGRAA
jgi:signal transduction histidine kinase